jgi:hypothetical protein
MHPALVSSGVIVHAGITCGGTLIEGFAGATMPLAPATACGSTPSAMLDTATSIDPAKAGTAIFDWTRARLRRCITVFPIPLLEFRTAGAT